MNIALMIDMIFEGAKIIPFALVIFGVLVLLWLMALFALRGGEDDS